MHGGSDHMNHLRAVLVILRANVAPLCHVSLDPARTHEDPGHAAVDRHDRCQPGVTLLGVGQRRRARRQIASRLW